jgi:hypothetical protein
MSHLRELQRGPIRPMPPAPGETTMKIATASTAKIETPVPLLPPAERVLRGWSCP